MRFRKITALLSGAAVLMTTVTGGCFSVPAAETEADRQMIAVEESISSTETLPVPLTESFPEMQSAGQTEDNAEKEAGRNETAVTETNPPVQEETGSSEQTQAETKQKAETETRAEGHTEKESGTESTAATEQQPESEKETESGTSQTEKDPLNESENKSDSEKESETENGSETARETESEPESEFQTEPDTELSLEEETETEVPADAGEENVNGLRKRIAAADICADPQPELLFLAAENVPESGTITAVLHVFTYNGVSAAEVFTQDMDPQSDPSGYCLFQVRDDKNLWIYREDPDAATIRSYTRYSLKGSSFSITYSLLQKAGETENVVNSYEDTCMISGNVFAEKEQEIRSALKDCIM